MITNEEYIEEYISTRGLSKATYQSTKLIMKHYSNFNEMSIHELLQEADLEEEQGIRWKKRKLKQRLIAYMNYTHETMKINSAKTYLRIIKSFYRHHEIEIQHLPPFNLKNANIVEPITYKDLPDKEILKKAIEITIPVIRALIFFLSSTGMSKSDALDNLTIQDFIEATRDYHNSNDIEEVIETLESKSEIDLIPTFRTRRRKTNKYYITFCTNECTLEICSYLKGRLMRKQLHPNDMLFDISKDYYTDKFAEINNTLKLGKVGCYNRFRGHMLRKFHATSLEKSGMDRYKINVLQGKSNNAVDDVYFFEDEKRLKKEYIQHMQSLLIFTEVKEVTIHSKEYLDIKKENELLKEQLEDIEKMKSEISKIKEWFIQ